MDKLQRLKKISFKNGMLLPVVEMKRRETNRRRSRTYRQKHPEKYREYAKRWRQKYPEKARESVRKSAEKRRKDGIDQIFQNYIEYLNGVEKEVKQ